VKFKVGQNLRYINEVGGGKLLSIIANGDLIILDEDGFESTVNPATVLIVDEAIDEHMLGSKKKAAPKRKVPPKTKKVKSKPNQGDSLVIDLHIERVYPNYRSLEKWDILHRQIGYLKGQLQKAKLRNVKKLIIVHGVGEGTLRKEVHLLLNGMKNVQYHDASYSQFGQGATHVEFY